MHERPNPDFPPQRYTGRYEAGFETDRERIEPSATQWERMFRAVENFVLCDPLLKSYEITYGNGERFLETEEAELMDCPPLVVYFKVDEENRRVAFLTVHRSDEVPGGWVEADGPPGRL